MSQTEQERFLEQQAAQNFDYGKEFRLKVAADYRLYVFLSPKQGVILSDLVDYAKGLDGFEAYRLVHKRVHIIHLYMRFQSADRAKVAIGTFKKHWEQHLHVASLSDMLEAMYAVESSNREYPLWTSTIIDTVGEVRRTNPLHRQVISVMLSRYGDPRIFDLQWEGDRVKSVQALFASLAEALGAAIALGPWVDDRNPYQNFHYRIRIVGGEKEISIFNQLKIPNAKLVFDMEYFVGGEPPSNPCYVPSPPPPPQQPVNDIATELLMQRQSEQRNEHQHNNYQPQVPMVDMAARLLLQRQNEQRNEPQQNNYPMNAPPHRGTHRQRGGRRSFPRRQFNNRNGSRQTPQSQVQQQYPQPATKAQSQVQHQYPQPATKAQSQVQQQYPQPATKAQSQVQQQYPQLPTKAQSQVQQQYPQPATKAQSQVQQQYPQLPTKAQSQVQQQYPQLPTKAQSQVQHPQPATKAQSQVQQQYPQPATKAQSQVQQQYPQLPTKAQSQVQQRYPQLPTKAQQVLGSS